MRYAAICRQSCHCLLTSMTVSQFTLLASTKKAAPDFRKAAPPIPAKELYDKFFASLQSLYQPDRVKDGVFQAMMDVQLINDGPVGIDYSSEDGVVNALLRCSLCVPSVAGANTDKGHCRSRSRSTPTRHQWTTQPVSIFQRMRHSRPRSTRPLLCRPLYWSEKDEGRAVNIHNPKPTLRDPLGGAQASPEGPATWNFPFHFSKRLAVLSR